MKYAINFDIYEYIDYLKLYVDGLHLNKNEEIKFLNIIVYSDREECNMSDMIRDLTYDKDLCEDYVNGIILDISNRSLDIVSRIIAIKNNFNIGEKRKIKRYQCIGDHGDSIIILSNKDEK